VRFRIGLLLPIVIAAACSGKGSSPATAASAPPVNEGSGTSTGGPSPVAFTTADGETLEAVRIGSGDRWVVLAHMRPADMNSWAKFAATVASRGATALYFNFRGYGHSTGDGFSVAVDVTAAVDYALSQGAAGVSVVGASMGGTGALAAAAERPLLAVATLSAPAEFEGTNALEAMPRVSAPLLVAAAEADRPYAAQAGLLVDAAGGDDAELLILSGAAHGTNLFATHSDLAATLLAFLGL